MKYKLNKFYVVSLVIIFILGFLANSFLTKLASKKIAVSQQKLPECILGLCPVYQSVSVDGDDSDSESLVVVPTAMTKGAGKLWIIDQGKLVFESKEYAQIDVEGSENGNGFILKYAIKPDYYTQNQKIRYEYKNREYKAVVE